MKNFEVLDIKNFEINPFTRIGDEWMLITAGNQDSFNTMTASWGTLGILWNKPIAICFVRPQRHTFQFIEKASDYTLNFFGPEHKEILKYCGSHSGRDVNKVKETGLKPIGTERGNVIFDQNTMAFECKKLYTGKFSEQNFLFESLIEKNYPIKDFHSFYIGEIVNIWKRLETV